MTTTCLLCQGNAELSLINQYYESNVGGNAYEVLKSTTAIPVPYKSGLRKTF